MIIQREELIEQEDGTMIPVGWPTDKTSEEVQLYTSRYQSKKWIIESGAAAVSISVGAPKFPLGYLLAGSLPELAPTYSMLRLDYDQYLSRYIDRLEKVGVSWISSRFCEIAMASGKHALVLLCYENVLETEDWCHRRMFAEWWEEKTGVVIPELAPGPVAKQGLLL